MTTKYVSKAGAYLLPHRVETDTPEMVKGRVQTLLGQRLIADTAGTIDDWTAINVGDSETMWIKTNQLSNEQQLKIFYTDVGQGDATIIEAEDTVVIVDGGPNQGLYTELVKRRERRRNLEMLEGHTPSDVQINAIVVSHFDSDHYAGIKYVLDDPDFTVERIYHNGLPRYSAAAGRDLNIGTKTGPAGSERITTDLTDIDSARQLMETQDFITHKGNLNRFGEFLQSAIKAHDEGRLGDIQRLFRRRMDLPMPSLLGLGDDIQIGVLGPVPISDFGPVRLPCFPNPHAGSASASESHTVNGNSIILKLTYGSHSFLFGGDLNQPAQEYLLDRYQNHGVFLADVNKACHHGSSDFHLPFLQEVQPSATVFSSGDSGMYDHPLPDAIGAAAKHSQGVFPLVFSTELAREGTRHLGHINARSNGTDLVMAQKKEKKSAKTPWHTFAVPNEGPFAEQK